MLFKLINLPVPYVGGAEKGRVVSRFRLKADIAVNLAGIKFIWLTPGEALTCCLNVSKVCSPEGSIYTTIGFKMCDGVFRVTRKRGPIDLSS